ncbi:hypothetical protein NDU88_007476 [Pleurodeles waltl]|uniref:Uncharacterized protein n=1 Tax=Pleurodeles waltl TaxID=8319 RepID=A0AAV7N255_PLEWA|nr:hypothetical protein NDU88_007476 [Pleurodeles waltl]
MLKARRALWKRNGRVTGHVEKTGRKQLSEEKQGSANKAHLTYGERKTSEIKQGSANEGRLMYGEQKATEQKKQA